MIRNFSDLEAWKQAHQIALSVYKITQKYPREEIFALTSQSRRAAASVGANIAEGFSRNTKKDKIHFYAMARGSLTELQNHMILSRDLGYVSPDSCSDFLKSSEWTIKLIAGLERSAADKN
ncbi:MAG: four helix bundle protein [bacterium]|nr:four helix bundle protein [bacterium]